MRGFTTPWQRSTLAQADHSAQIVRVLACSHANSCAMNVQGSSGVKMRGAVEKIPPKVCSIASACFCAYLDKWTGTINEFCAGTMHPMRFCNS